MADCGFEAVAGSIPVGHLPFAVREARPALSYCNPLAERLVQLFYGAAADAFHEVRVVKRAR